MARRIAVIDDDQAFLDLLGDLLEDEGYEPYLFAVMRTAHWNLDEVNPDAIVLDLHQDTPDVGYRVLESIRRTSGLRVKPVILCACEAEEQMARLRDGQGCAVLPKPFAPDDLMRLLERLVSPLTPAPLAPAITS